MYRLLLVPVLCSLIFTPVVVVLQSVATAQVMSSENFHIQSDSINIGGGRSTSESFIQESTFGELATGDSDSENFALRAGFQQMQTIFISLTGAQSVALTPNIPGVTGGEANGSTTVTVVTDNPAGYELTIRSENAPAMQGPDSATLADYDAGAEADYEFEVGLSDAHFGFSPHGAHVVDRYLSATLTCGSGTSVAEQCWDGLSTEARVIARSLSANHPSGSTTTIHFRAGVGGTVNQQPGTYVATTTITALPL